jgi:Salmonella virulence plasmid 65kDa B protein
MADQNAADLISLPQGGGALAGIGETFQPDPHTGTGNFSIPLPLPPGRGALQPQLTLAYSTGSPNGPFGLGWALSLPQVRRNTRLAIPRYQDNIDGFVLSGAEDLVPVPTTDDSQRYRPKTEGSFARITHISGEATGDYWEVWSKDGLRSRYGTPKPGDAEPDWRDPAAIIGPDGIFAWLISETVDLPGNRIAYAYQSDPAGERMRYLSDVRYADYGDRADPEYLVSVQVSYEQRPDPFSDRRAGFELRTTQRATTIAISTHAPAATLAKTVELTYSDETGAPTRSGVSLLTRITIVGHDGENTQQLPPLELGYTDWQLAGRARA